MADQATALSGYFLSPCHHAAPIWFPGNCSLFLTCVLPRNNSRSDQPVTPSHPARPPHKQHFRSSLSPSPQLTHQSSNEILLPYFIAAMKQLNVCLYIRLSLADFVSPFVVIFSLLLHIYNLVFPFPIRLHILLYF